MTLIIDSTGTMLDAQTCYVVPDYAFTEDEWEDIDNFSNTEIARIGKENGFSVERTSQLLESIADALWGEGADTEWNSDTLMAIADAVEALRPDLHASRI